MPLCEAEKRGQEIPGHWDDLLAARSIEEAHTAVRKARVIADWERAARTGGYPVAVAAVDDATRTQWFDSYVRTYLERDLQDFAAIAALTDFRRLMRLAALRIGQMLNQSELGRDAGLSQPTTHRYLNLLEASFQIVRLTPFARSRTKRLIKTPKLYWTDTGLGAHLAGWEGGDDRLSGAVLENWVLAQLLVWRETRILRPEIQYWRTHSGQEVDFVIEAGRRLLPVEVKRATRIRTADASGLEAFLDEHGSDAPFGVLMYGGREAVRLTNRVVAAPFGIIL